QSSTYTYSLARYTTNCVSQQLSATSASPYDANGRLVGPSPTSVTAPVVIEVAPGTIGRYIYDAVCAYARGGDLQKSRVFPKGASDPDLDLRPVPGFGPSSEFSIYIDAKSLYRDKTKSFVLAKAVGKLNKVSDNLGKDNREFFFLWS